MASFGGHRFATNFLNLSLLQSEILANEKGPTLLLEKGLSSPVGSYVGLLAPPNLVLNVSSLIVIRIMNSIKAMIAGIKVQKNSR